MLLLVAAGGCEYVDEETCGNLDVSVRGRLISSEGEMSDCHGRKWTVHATLVLPLESFRPKSGTVAIDGTLDGLFIGVGDYQPTSQIRQTPALPIAAAALRSFFADAVRTAQDHESRLTLVADLSMNPKDLSSGFASVDQALRFLDPDDFREYDPFFSLHRGEKWHMLGSGRLVDHQLFWDSIHAHVASLQSRIAGNHKTLTAVVYLAAHGVLDGRGQPNLYLADSELDRPDSWVSYKSILEAYRPLYGATGLRLIFIFDACQQPDQQHDGNGDVPRPTEEWLADIRSPVNTNAVVITSDAPGEYAYHWTGDSFVRREIVPSSSGAASGSGTASRSVGTKKFEPTMSIFPLAVLGTAKAAERWVVEDVQRPCGLMIGTWTSAVAHNLQKIMAADPNLADHQQNVLIYYPSPVLDTSLLTEPLLLIAGPGGKFDPESCG